MSEIEQFQFGERQVRVIDLDGDPWWVARDVCDVLGLGNITEALRGLDDDEFRSTELIGSDGRRQPNAQIVSESGLYSLILRSRKPEAKAFKRWVTHEVLPAIRRTGSYQVTPASVQITINALAEIAHKEHVVPGAARILAFHRWRKPRKGIEAFVQLTLDLNMPAIGSNSRKEITGGNGS